MAKRRTTKPVSKEDRQRLFDEVKGKCAYCGKSIQDYFEVDHVTPVRKGGKDCYDNYLASCGSCNIQKSSLTIEQFRSNLLYKHKQMLRDSSKYRALIRFGIIENNIDELEFHFEKIGIEFRDKT